MNFCLQRLAFYCVYYMCDRSYLHYLSRCIVDCIVLYEAFPFIICLFLGHNTPTFLVYIRLRDCCGINAYILL